MEIHGTGSPSTGIYLFLKLTVEERRLFRQLYRLCFNFDLKFEVRSWDKNNARHVHTVQRRFPRRSVIRLCSERQN